MLEPTELGVVEHARHGDAAALTALYEHFKQDVFRFIYYRTGDLEVAADLTGDVFERAIKALPGYQPERPFAAWLFQITRNSVIDYWRQQQVRQDVPLDELMSGDGASPEQAVEQNLTVERLAWALQHLTVDQREVLILRFVVGLNVATVAAALDKSNGAVQMLQQRALESLRNRLLIGEEMG
ncbi:MAG: sigma-70 family RNA polymerase sigma factor [Chloroflexi bacterium]|nr:sigma-70 family RNA polymerase sigma factor [Chloroflexota bacterium]MCI0579288.1 sigma-70 family RNA polymerase sigma factor [Chloroflexota bacterium]MCI0644352.1 sigma-70 family RNA polymerase sigma factor [Chloroflexota bacterium]MCI0728522.1 sigma-70 family RNA polymerase sigma factor [Chloroflexota bacterium]